MIIVEELEFITFKSKNISKKVTSKKAASAASKVLRDPRASKASKTAAGSALSQRERRSKK